MEIKETEREPSNGATDVASPYFGDQAEQALWVAAATLYRRWRLIAAITLGAAVLSVLLAFSLDKWYAAEARVLQPEGGGLSLSGVLGEVAGGLDIFGAGGEYTRYLAILTSRTMMEDVVEAFDLVTVYELEDSEVPVYDAINLLDDNVEFEVSLDYDYLGVRAYDRDPERAAAMANFMVNALNTEYAALSSSSARLTRVFIEQRLEEALADLDSVRSEIQAFQEQYGVVELESQAQAFMTSMAGLKAEAARVEIQYETLVRQYGPDNPQVQAARGALSAARSQVRGALSGRDALMPVAMDELPALSRRYAELMQDQLIQAQIVETIYPLYEQSAFQERRDAVAVQVVDEAIPPVEAARPSRRLVAIGITLSAFLVACVFVLAQAWLRRNYRLVAQRLNQAA